MNHQRRIVINLVFFAALGVVLAIWAVTSIIDIDALRRPVPVTAEFDSSPGLSPDLEVTHLGVRVGKIGEVRLKPGSVHVRIDLDRDARVPSTVGARVMRKSAIGEPHIELTTPPPSSAEPRPLRAGDHIPLSRTTGTADYQKLFGTLGDTLKAVDPRDAQTLVHELATGLEGRQDSLRDAIADTHRLTGALAGEAGTLDALSAQVTRLTGTLAGRRSQIASGVHDLALVSTQIRRSRRDLETVLDEGPDFLTQVHRLLEEARPGLGCLLTAAGAPSEPLFTPANEAKIHHVLTMVPTLRALVSDITVVESGARWARIMPVLTIAGPDQAAEFAKPRPKPKAEPLNVCPATPGASSRQAGAFAAGGKAGTAGGSLSEQGATALRKTAGEQGAEPSPPARTAHLLPPLVAALILIMVAARFLRTVIRRRPGR